MGHLSTGTRTHLLPDSPEPRQTDSTRSASFVYFEALLLLRVRSAPSGLFTLPAVVTLLVSCLSRALPLTPWVLEPALVLRPEHVSPTRRGVTRDVRDLAAPASGGISPFANERLDPLDRIPAPFETGPHRLSAMPRLP